MKKIILLYIGMALICTSVLYAATLNVTWVPNSDPDIASYKIYNGNTVIGTTNHPTVTFDIPNVADGVFNIYISAVDVAGNESVKSDPATITVNVVPPNKPTGLKLLLKN